jgi:hypothetical protein
LQEQVSWLIPDAEMKEDLADCLANALEVTRIKQIVMI